jgi:lysophospholipase L1-like esterase
VLRRSVHAALAGLLTASVIVVITALSLPAAHAATPVRVMPLGDSITGSPGCWRALLWSRLQSAGITNVDLVGTLPPQGCGVTYDGDNEGHGGILATNMADGNQLPPWLAATHPDIVMMHLGTNDVWSGRTPSVILTAFSKLVDQMRASNPSMKILVAKIIPMGTQACAECPQRVIDFDNTIQGWANGKTTGQSPIIVVDQWTGFNTATDTTDGVHPNNNGNQKISDRWFPQLSAAINGTTPPTTPPVTTPPPTTPPRTTPPPTTPPVTTPPPTTPPGNGSCTGTWRLVNSWPGGFQGEVTVRAGSAPITSWAVRWTLAGGQSITQLWNGALTVSGSSVTVRNLSYNGSLPANGTTVFGFLSNGSPSTPNLSCALT